MDKKQIWSFLRTSLLWFLVFYLAFSWYSQRNEAPPEEVSAPVGAISVQGTAATFRTDDPITWSIEVRDADAVQAACSLGASFDLARVRLGGADALGSLSCEDIWASNQAPTSTTLTAPESWRPVFEPDVLYQLAFVLTEGDTSTQIEGDYAPIEVKERGFFGRLFRAIITQPIFNILAFTAQHVGYSLGLAVIITTLLIRLLLFFPNQKALASQQKMQALQPKIQELQAKYKNNQQELGQRMMELYKEEKISPLSGCVPVLLQMPILFGIYMVMQEGIAPHMASLLYAPLQGFDFAAVRPLFLSMDLTKVNLVPLPIIVAAAQWFAMHLSFSSKAPAEGQSAQMQKIMQWAFPIMIGVFTLTLPAAVGLYWLTSTLFGIAQQQYVNAQLAQTKKTA